VTPAMVSSLKPGMSKDEVLSIMGQSVLENVFTNNHWAYVYTFQHSGGKILKKRLDLYFQNNRLVHMTGDFGSF
jgi:outer membrane protein assembly factor BamE